MEKWFVRCSNKGDEIASAKKSDSEATAEVPHNDQSFFAEDATLKPCPEWEEKLAATHPDDLTLEELSALEEHLKTCPSCVAVRRLDRIVDTVIRNLPVHDDTSLLEPSLELPPLLRALSKLPDYLENPTDEAKESWTEFDTHVDRPLRENNIDCAPLADYHFTQGMRGTMANILITLKQWISYIRQQLVKWYRH